MLRIGAASHHITALAPPLMKSGRSDYARSDRPGG